MTRDNPLKIPTVNPPHTPIEPLPILGAGYIPQEPFLRHTPRLRAKQPRKQPRQHAGRRALRTPRILLRRREIEHQIRLDQRLVRAMAKHQFFVPVAPHILDVELAVKLLIHLHLVLVVHRPHVAERRAGGFFRLLALLGEAVGAEEFGGGKGARPFGEEDVVFEVEGGEVSDVVAEGGDGGADFGGEGCGGEDGEAAGLETDC